MAAPYEDWLATLDALQEGDRVALVKVTKVITGFLTRFRAYEMRDSWDDVIQEVLISLIRSARKGAIRDPRGFINYVGTTVRRKLIDFAEKSKRPGAPDKVGDLAAAESSGAALPRPPETSVDVLLDLQTSLEGLDPPQRRVIEALYLQGHRYEEAAKLLDLPLGTLKRLQTQGLRKLREIFLQPEKLT